MIIPVPVGMMVATTMIPILSMERTMTVATMMAAVMTAVMTMKTRADHFQNKSKKNRCCRSDRRHPSGWTTSAKFNTFRLGRHHHGI